MFPISLDYSLAIPIAQCPEEAIQALFPALSWGVESDLMKASEEWPDAVALIKANSGHTRDDPAPFPVNVRFIWFPGRVAGNERVMVPTKLGLLRRLATAFECRVLCRGPEFCRKEAGTHGCGRREMLLCQNGRVFSAPENAFEACVGSPPDSGWIPLDDLPPVVLADDGSLNDETGVVSSVEGWIKERDQSHLDSSDPANWSPEQDGDDEEGAFRQPAQKEQPKVNSKNVHAYLERVDLWEKGYEVTAGKLLLQRGISLPAPDELTDAELQKKLWEVIGGLQKTNTYIHDTNHLSDRELYTWLWEDGLNEEDVDLVALSDSGWHLSPIGSGDKESARISLIYYYSAKRRADWRANRPGKPIPAHIDPPYDRDRLLPNPGI